MKPVFIDASFILALEFGRDQNHQSAAECWADVQATGRLTLTTSFILDEVVTHLNARGHHRRALAVGDHLMDDAEAFVFVDRELFDAG